MNIFNSILNSVKETFTNKDNRLTIYLFGIVGYYTVETYRKAMFMLKKSGPTEDAWPMISYGVNSDNDLRLCESLFWPLSLIKQLSPYIIYELHKENVVKTIPFYEEYDSINSDIDVNKEE